MAALRRPPEADYGGRKVRTPKGTVQGNTLAP